MLVAAGNIILFYDLPDLKTWEPVGGFGLGYGATMRRVGNARSV